MTTNAALALVDALFTAASLACLLLGYRAVRRKQIERHRRFMLGAFGASAAFMIVFVIRFASFGFGAFHGSGVVRGVYLGVFLSHEPLAVINVPLAIAAVILGLRRSIAAHREVARIAFPIWVYVAITGLAIYALLYLR
jgi:putative membrane protein